jgi:glycosyltransferase involved in cell wall biosynthesis
MSVFAGDVAAVVCEESIILRLADSSAPRVTIVIPVYAADPDLFRLALHSLLAQTFADFELIVVEDPSPSSVAAVVNAADDRRVTFHRNEVRTSQAAKYNWGLRRARGQYLARFDADDMAEAHRLATQVAFLDSHPEVDIVGSDLTLIDERGAVLGVRRYPRSHDEIARAMRRFNAIANPTVMFRRAVFEQSGGWTEEPVRPVRDYDWISRMIIAGHRVSNIGEPLVRYRIHRGGVKQKSLRASIRATIDVKRAHWWPTMTPLERAQVAGEAALLLLPPRFVLWLFLRLRTQRR